MVSSQQSNPDINSSIEITDRLVVRQKKPRTGLYFVHKSYRRTCSSSTEVTDESMVCQRHYKIAEMSVEIINDTMVCQEDSCGLVFLWTVAVACDVYDGVFCAVLFPTRCLG